MHPQRNFFSKFYLRPSMKFVWKSDWEYGKIWVSGEKDLCRGREEQDEFQSSVLDQVWNRHENQTENMEGLSSSEKDLCRGREKQDEFKSSVLEQVCNCFDSQTENTERFEL